MAGLVGFSDCFHESLFILVAQQAGCSLDLEFIDACIVAELTNRATRELPLDSQKVCNGVAADTLNHLKLSPEHMALNVQRRAHGEGVAGLIVFDAFKARFLCVGAFACWL